MRFIEIHGRAMSGTAAQSTLLVSKQIRLQKPADWSVWLSFIRMIAEIDNDLNLINFDHEIRSDHLSESEKPMYVKNINKIDLENTLYEKQKWNFTGS